MTSRARITTIIPTFCRRALLERAVASALGQGGDEISVRVFDNASSDDTEAAMRGLAVSESRLHYHRHTTNIGGAANFDFGLSSVDTEFFSILSDDDYLLPGFYDQALSALDDDPNAMFWAGCTLDVNEEDVIVEARVAQWQRHGRFVGEEGVMSMTHGRAPAWTGIVFRRGVLDRFGLPDHAAGGPADLDFVLRAAAHWPFIVSRHPSAVFTLNSASFSATQPLASFWPGWLHMIANVRAWSGLPADARKRVADALEHDARRMAFRRGVFALVSGRLDFARDAARALRATPGGAFKGNLLGVGLLFARSPGVVAILRRVYRWLEARLTRQRDLQSQYGSLLRNVQDSGRD